VHRFYLSPNDWASACLTGSESHHAQDVLRLETGDRLVIFDGCGREATAEISAADGGTVHLRVLQEALTPKLPARLSLAQAIPKGKNMELIVQKAVEIGAAEVFPLLSSRSVVQLDADSAVQRQCKWHNVAIEAAKQCGQNWLPQVHLPGSPENFFSRLETNFDLQLIGSLQPGAMHLKKVLADYADTHNGGRPASVLMVIGPEGDFTPAEIALARSHGCTPITLGPIILRVETAAIYCLSILSYELLGSR
jgi:16S rRNA (uracil1498-N3)-methyltransferase